MMRCNIKGNPRMNSSLAFARIAVAIACCVALASSAADSDLSVNARLLLAARNSDVAALDRALQAGASAAIASAKRRCWSR
jgi:hypothetical protein